MKNKIEHFGPVLLFVLLISQAECKVDQSHTLPLIETLNVTEITKTTAKSGGNIISDGGVEIKEKGVCWNIISNPNVDNFKTNEGTGNESFESLLTNLKADEKYYVKAYAVNDLGISYGNEKSFTTSSVPSEGQIIADHRAVSDFDNIPGEYISEVKKMMVWFPGESHSYAYRDGLDLLEAEDATYQCTNVWGFLDYTDQYLRVVGWPTEGIGEEHWYTWKAYHINSLPAASKTYKTYIKENSAAGKPIHLMGFAWCYDMVHQNGPTAKADPILNVHWYGTSVGGPDGSLEWGIDAEDISETGNRVSLATYLAATEDYIEYCRDSGYITEIAFTTHPVDAYTGEGGYQVYLKNEAIRDYVAAHAARILFDYADILCYDDDGQQTTTTWNGHTYPVITPANLGDASIGHIGTAGAIRLAKAQWWLLARIAGWDGK